MNDKNKQEYIMKQKKEKRIYTQEEVAEITRKRIEVMNASKAYELDAKEFARDLFKE